MQKDVDSEKVKLLEQNEQLRKELEQSHHENDYLKNQNKHLEKKIKALLDRIFGKKSEKIDPNQLKLFEAELEKEQAVPSNVNFDDLETEADFEDPPKKKKRNG